MRTHSAWFVVFAASGCFGSSPPETATVALRVGNAQPVAARSDGLLAVTDGTNTLTLRQVKMTLEDIDLERSETSVDCSAPENADAIDCADSVPGPLLLNLNLTGPVVFLNLDVPVGTYDQVELDISVPDGGDPAQSSYLTANPDMTGTSMRVLGAFNGAPFEFELDLTGKLAIPLDPPLGATANASGLSVNLTMNTDHWFFDDAAALIDPRTVCAVGMTCALRDQIEANIGPSIEADASEAPTPDPDPTPDPGI